MKTTAWRHSVLAFMAAGALAAEFGAGESTLPEFGASVTFGPDARRLTAENLRGKAAIILFIQSWCPKCNEWGGKVFKQIEEAHGENPGIMLLAIKTGNFLPRWGNSPPSRGRCRRSGSICKPQAG